MTDKKTIEEHNLTLDEFNRIVQLIGREPNITELGIFSLMWSEHCSYKSSKVHLKKLPVQGKNVIQGPGENAGVIDIGDGLAIVFKIEYDIIGEGDRSEPEDNNLLAFQAAVRF